MRVPLITSTLLHAAAVGLVGAAAGALLPSPPPEWTLEVRLVGAGTAQPGGGAGAAAAPPGGEASAPARERQGGRVPDRLAPDPGEARWRLPAPPDPSSGPAPGATVSAGAPRPVEKTPAPEAPAAGVAERISSTGEPATRPVDPDATAPGQGEQAAGPRASAPGLADRSGSGLGEAAGATPLRGIGLASDRSGSSRSGHAGSPGPGAAGQAGNGPGQERSGYPLGAIAARLRSATRYPFDARARGVEGMATVRFRLGPRGEVEGVDLLRSSGDRALDEAALDAVRRGAPYPAVTLTVEAPIVFNLDERPARR